MVWGFQVVWEKNIVDKHRNIAYTKQNIKARRRNQEWRTWEEPCRIL